MHLGYFGLEVSSLENWHHFATNIVGVPVSRDADGTLGLRLDGYARRFIITEGSLDSLSFAGFELAGSRRIRGLQRRAARPRCRRLRMHGGRTCPP